MTKKPAIPAIPSSVPRDIAAVLRPMKQLVEAIQSAYGNSTGASGAAGSGAGASLPDVVRNHLTDATIPPTPTGLVISGGMAVIIIEFDPPPYANHAHTEIWRANADDFSQAKLVATTNASVYTDAIGGEKVAYYWIRFVSSATPPRTGPFNSAAGTRGETGMDAAYLQQILTNKITANQLALNAVTPDKLAAAAIDMTKFASGIRPPRVVSSLPTLPNAAWANGDTAVLTTDGKLYRVVSSTWKKDFDATDISGQVQAAQIAGLEASKVTGQLSDSQLAAISAAKVTGQLVSSQIAAGIIDQTKLASDMEVPKQVSTLPSTHQGTDLVVLTTDRKLYRWNGTAYVSTTAATDITGQLAASQVAALEASKITGQLSDAQLAAISAAKLTGQLASSQLEDGAVTAAKLSVEIGGGNMLPNSSFEVDSDGNGQADGWIGYGSGTRGTVTPSLVPDNKFHGAKAQKISATSLGTATTDRIGIYRSIAADWSGRKFVFSAYAMGNAGATIRVYVDWFGGGGYLTSIGKGTVADGIKNRYVLKATAPAGATYGSFYVWLEKMPSQGPADLYVDAVQLEFGDVLTAYAPKPDEILPGTITATEISDSAITTPKLAAGAVVAGKIAAGAISATEIQSGAITTAKLAAGAVTANEIAASTITGAKIAADTITGANIAAGTITASEIAAATITSTELASGSVTTAKLVAGAVTTTEIAAGAVTTAKVAANAITANKLAADAVTAGKIQAGAVTAAAIAAGAITADALSVGAVTATKIAILPNPMSLTSDPSLNDVSDWIIGDGVQVVNVSTLPVSNKAFKASNSYRVVLSRMVPFDRTKTYRACGWATNGGTGSNKSIFLLVGFYDKDGAIISGVSAGNWGGGTYFYYGLFGAAAPSDWTEYSVIFGPAESKGIPSNAAFVRVGALLNSNASATGDIWVGGLRVQQVNDAELIVDGAITANKIQAGAVTTAKLAAGAVTANEIAASTITGAKIAANTITAANIAADTITAAQIAAGAIGASEIAAGAITTAKLAITAPGSALNADPGCQDASAWITWSGTATFTTVTDGKVGNAVMRSTGTGVSWMNGKEKIPIDPAKAYRLRFWARKSATANGTLYGVVALQDSAGANIGGDGAQWAYMPMANPGSTSWMEYVGYVGAGTGRSFPATARTMRAGIILNNNGTAGYFEAQDIRIEEVLPATLIQDGAITTAKIAAGAVTANEIAANSVIASKIAALAVQASHIQAGAIVADKIATDAITATKIKAGEIQTSHLAAASITTAALAAGAVTANEIAAGAVTANKISATSLSAINANLGTITAGKAQNSTGTSYVDLNASGAQSFIKVGSAIDIKADGSGSFARSIISAPNIVASGVKTVSSGSLGSGETFVNYIDTGIDLPVGWDSASSDMFLASATISGGTSSSGGRNGYSTIDVVYGDGLLTKQAYNNPADNRIYLRFTWNGYSGTAGTITISELTWKLVKV